MIFFKLTADSHAKERRDALGNELGIGYGNCAQFITRLNNYGIIKEEFIKAVEKINKEMNYGEFDD